MSAIWEIPSMWVRPYAGSWHLLRRGMDRTFCGRFSSDWPSATTRVRDAPRVHAASGLLVTDDGPWPDYSCWSCMDAYAALALRTMSWQAPVRADRQLVAP